MTKSSGSVSFRSSRKSSGKKTPKNSSPLRGKQQPQDRQGSYDAGKRSSDRHYEEFPFSDNFRGFDDPYDNTSSNSHTGQDEGLKGSSSYRPNGSRDGSSSFRQNGSRDGSSSFGQNGGRYSDPSSRQNGGRYNDPSSRQNGRPYSDPSSRQNGNRNGNPTPKKSGTSGSNVAYRQGKNQKGNANRTSAGGSGDRGIKKKKKPIGCLIPVLIVIILIALFYLAVFKSVSKVEKHKTDMSGVTVNQQDKNMKKYQTIALFGVDDQNNVIHDKGSRTDSIIVARIDKRTKKVKLMSIYRDTYVSIDGKYDKINAAYSYGGPEQAMNTINRNLDLGITDFATVNFKALADAVDILGGITLTIESEKELKNLNDYIGNMNKINGGKSPKFKETGTHTFDGNQAVAYSRIRYMEGGDHARASHQRLVVEGILKEAKKQPWKIPKLIDKVLPQCKTSFSANELSKMALALFLYDIEDSQAYPFDSFDERYDGIWYGFPTTVESNVIKAHEYLYGTKDYKPTDELLKISEKVKYIADEVSPY